MSNALKTIVGFVIFTVIGNLLLRKIPAKLVENALTGWADNAIADALGITAPQAATVLTFVWDWVVPAALAVLVVWLWHLWYTDNLVRPKTPIDLRRRALLAPAILTALLFIAFAASSVWLYKAVFASASEDKRIVRLTPFYVASYVYPQARPIKTASGKDTDLYETTYYLGIGNDEPNGKNLKKVQVRLFGYEIASQTTLLGSDTQIETDLRHGELAYFKIGRVVSKKWLGGMPKSPIILEDKDVDMYVHNEKLGSLSFEIWNAERKRQFGLSSSPHMQKPSVWPLGVLVTADDIKSVQVALKIDFANEKELVSISNGEADAKEKK